VRHQFHTHTKQQVELCFLGAGEAQSVHRLSYGLDERGSISEGGNDGIFSLHPVRTSSGSHPASYPNGDRVLLPRVKSNRGMKLTTHLHLLPKLRIRGVIPPLPQ